MRVLDLIGRYSFGQGTHLKRFVAERTPDRSQLGWGLRMECREAHCRFYCRIDGTPPTPKFDTSMRCVLQCKLHEEGKVVLNRPQQIALVIASISLATMHSATANPLCPNLSGNYVAYGEDGAVHIAIHQRGCNHIEIVSKTNYLGTVTSEMHTLKLDGKDQKDLPWFGSVEQYTTSARFVGPELQVKARTTSGSILTMIYLMTPARDLLEEALTNPRGVPVLAKREK